MRFTKLQVLTASVFFVLGSQAGNVLAVNGTASPQGGGASATSQAPTAAPAQPPAYRGYRGYRGDRGYRYPRYRGYDRGYTRPFGDSGPSFRGPWRRKGSGSGFGFGSDDGPGFGRGPRYGGWDDWGPDPFFDTPFMDDPYYDRGGPRYYDRGPRFSGPDDWDWGGSGMGFGW